MKRFLLLVALILSVCILVCGCQAKEQGEGDTSAQSSQSTGQNVSSQISSSDNSSSETQEPVLPEISPECVGIYIPAEDGTASRVRITEFSSVRTAKKDIDCFEIFASAQDKLTGGSFRTIWQQAWDGHTDTQGAKIGFWIEFSLPEGVYVRRQILNKNSSFLVQEAYKTLRTNVRFFLNGKGIILIYIPNSQYALFLNRKRITF